MSFVDLSLIHYFSSAGQSALTRFVAGITYSSLRDDVLFRGCGWVYLVVYYVAVLLVMAIGLEMSVGHAKEEEGFDEW